MTDFTEVIHRGWALGQKGGWRVCLLGKLNIFVVRSRTNRSNSGFTEMRLVTVGTGIRERHTGGSETVREVRSEGWGR